MYADELFQINKSEMAFDIISGEFMCKKELAFYKALSSETNGIYGD